MNPLRFYRRDTGRWYQIQLSFQTHFMTDGWLSDVVYNYAARVLTKRLVGLDPPRHYTIGMLKLMSESIYNETSS